jgi:ADP-ribose pyrophosphatase
MTFQPLHEEILYQGRVFNVARVKFQLPNGKTPTYDLVQHSGAVTIVPVDAQGKIWFVKQFRLGAEKDLLELPAGLLEEGETAETCAAREIQEEIGQAPGQLRHLGEFYMVPGYSTEKMVVYLATELYPASLPQDENELIECIALPKDEAYRMARAGEIQDGKTLAALLLAAPFLEQ